MLFVCLLLATLPPVRVDDRQESGPPVARAITLIRSASLSDVAEYAYAATAAAELRLLSSLGVSAE